MGAPALRHHVFWECPVARAVQRVVCRCMPGVLVHCSHVWLCVSPSPRVLQQVWDVVCLAALSAMELGRRTMWAVHLQREGVVPDDDVPNDAHLRQVTLFEAWGVDGPAVPGPEVEAAAVPRVPLSPVQRASQVAVADFWNRLQDFVSTQNRARVQWRHAASLGTDHPFVSVEPAAVGVDANPRRRLRVSVVVEAAQPD